MRVNLLPASLVWARAGSEFIFERIGQIQRLKKPAFLGAILCLPPVCLILACDTAKSSPKKSPQGWAPLSPPENAAHKVSGQKWRSMYDLLRVGAPR